MAMLNNQKVFDSKLIYFILCVSDSSFQPDGKKTWG